VPGKLAGWDQSAAGALARTMLLDQVPLNMFRNRPDAFAPEALSRAAAGRAIERGYDCVLPSGRPALLHLPCRHSESPVGQARSVALFAAAGLEDNLTGVRCHREFARRFGRFPHRHAVPARGTAPAEWLWLDTPDGTSPCNAAPAPCAQHRLSSAARRLRIRHSSMGHA
jgi:uncharacterized protein (DUF924 family)